MHCIFPHLFVSALINKSDIRLGFFFSFLFQCCAISFIETLTHESLSMPQTEFNALMSGQIAIHSVWESALMSCEMMHMLDENCKTMTALEKRNAETLDGTQQLDTDINEFRENLTKNLESVLKRTQFEVKEIKTLQSLRSALLPQSITHRMSIDKTNQPHQTHLTSNNPSSNSSGHFKSNLVASMASINLKSKESPFSFALEPEQSQSTVLTTVSNVQRTDLLSAPIITEADSFADGNVLIPSVSDPMKSSPTVDYLSVSPSFGPCSLSFDNQSSFDETTPDEFAPINFLKGITNINYDFTFSDNSADNSISEDIGNPPATADDSSNQIKPSDSMSSFNLDEFDPLRNTEPDTEPKTATSSQIKPTNINLNDPKPTTLIESEDSPNQVYLPSPLKPTATDYKGFSNSNIPSISCNTGDFSSLNHSNDTQS